MGERTMAHGEDGARGRIAAYTLLNFAKHGAWSFFGFFGLVYLTDVVGVEPATAGAILLASLVFDALIDPPAGAAIDWIRSRLRDYQPLIAASALASAAGLALFFSAHALGLGLVGCVVLLLAFRLAFTVFDLCDNALAARITTSPRERTTLSAWRKAAAALASLATGAAVGVVASDPAETALRLPVFAALIAAVSVSVALGGYGMLRTLDRAAPRLEPVGLAARVTALGRSKDALVLAGLALLEASATPILVGGLLYFSRALTGDADWAGTAIVVWTLAQLLALPGWAWAAGRLGKRVTLALSHVLTAGACAGFAFLGAAAGPVGAWALVAAMGAAIGGVSTLRWSLAPDLIDAAARGGLRVETTLVGLVSGAVQIGAGLAVAGLGAVLAAHGYDAQDPGALAAPALGASLGGWVAAAHGACAILTLLWAAQGRKPS